MPALRTTRSAVLWCALLFLLLISGCRGTPIECPVATVTAEPQEVLSGVNQTDLFVEVTTPNFEYGLELITTLTAVSGTIADPFALKATYTCAHDVSGPVEICATATYLGDEPDGDVPNIGVQEANVGRAVHSEDANVSAAYEYLRLPHVRIPDPLECSETRCTSVVCPEEGNLCPVVSSFTVEPMVIPEGETATIEVVAEDPDDNPPLVTTVTAKYGTISDPHASKATYACDPDAGGVIQICLLVSDGDSSCDVEECIPVRCPGDPLENTCPIIESFTATPISPGVATTTVRVVATDLDEFPEPLRTALSSSPTGVFTDPFATETTFSCEEPGPVRLRVEASDGDPLCDKTDEITVVCPLNECPMLFVINAIPALIPPGQTSTAIETRGQDTDGLPLPLVLTLNALWGSFEDTDNIQEPFNVVAQNATYICDRPGRVEVCVDGTDGACLKTLCTNVNCPDDVPTPP